VDDLNATFDGTKFIIKEKFIRWVNGQII
jgi:hypothetical protein